MARPQTQSPRTFPNGQPIKAETPPPMDEATRERIARRAYEIYLARGGVHGDELQDWVQAERELRLGRM